MRGIRCGSREGGGALKGCMHGDGSGGGSRRKDNREDREGP